MLKLKNKAFIVTCLFDPPLKGIYWALTAGKARYKALLNARDAGYYQLEFKHLTVKRAKQYDPPYYNPFVNGTSLEYIETRRTKTVKEGME